MASNPIPALTPEQRADALARALECRRHRAEFKERLRDGKYSMEVALAMACDDDVLAGIRVVDFLKCLPGLGEVKAEKVMAKYGIAPNRRIRGLGEVQIMNLKQYAADNGR